MFDSNQRIISRVKKHYLRFLYLGSNTLLWFILDHVSGNFGFDKNISLSEYYMHIFKSQILPTG